MILAARLIGKSGVDLLQKPELIKAAAAELKTAQGPNFKYAALLGNRNPPLDYRN